MQMRTFGDKPLFAFMENVAEAYDEEYGMDIKRYQLLEDVSSVPSVLLIPMDFHGLKMQLGIDKASILEIMEASPFVVTIYETPAPDDSIRSGSVCEPQDTYLSLQPPQGVKNPIPVGVIYHETDEPSSRADKSMMYKANQFLYFVQGGLYDVGYYNWRSNDPDAIDTQFYAHGLSADELHSNLMDITLELGETFIDLTDELVDCIDTRQTATIEELCPFER